MGKQCCETTARKRRDLQSWFNELSIIHLLNSRHSILPVPYVCSFVCARNGDQNRLVLMCSYHVEETSQPRRFHDPGDETGLKIWQAALATSAAPSFFKPVKLNGISFIDGGLGYNNPAFEVLDEGEDLFDFSVPGPDKNAKGLACLVSIGTGEAKVVSAYNWRRSLRQRVVPIQTIRAMIAIVTDCDSTHERLTRRFRSCPDKYFRFNVEHGLEDIGLDHWKKLDEVERATEKYVAQLEDRHTAVHDVNSMSMQV